MASVIDSIMGIYPHKTILGFQEVRTMQKGFNIVLNHSADVVVTHMLEDGRDCGYTYYHKLKLLVVETDVDEWLVYKVIR